MRDTYDGGEVWGVRWGEPGTPVRCREYGDEEQARSMHDHLTKRYLELGYTGDKPQLIAAKVEWQIVCADEPCLNPHHWVSRA